MDVLDLRVQIGPADVQYSATVYTTVVFTSGIATIPSINIIKLFVLVRAAL